MIATERGQDMEATTVTAVNSELLGKFVELHEALTTAARVAKWLRDEVTQIIAAKITDDSTARVYSSEPPAAKATRNGAPVAKSVKTKIQKVAKTAKAAKKNPVAASTRESPIVKPGGVFSTWLKEIRTASGLSQPEFGEKVGASRTQIWHWEKGTMAPGETALERIESYLRETCPAR